MTGILIIKLLGTDGSCFLSRSRIANNLGEQSQKAKKSLDTGKAALEEPALESWELEPQGHRRSGD